MSKTLIVKTPATKTPRKSSKAVVAPEPVRKTRAPKGQGYANHDFERKSEDFPCKACNEPYLHSRGFCSKCYNSARKPFKAGLQGQALINAVKIARKIEVTASDKAKATKEVKSKVTPPNVTLPPMKVASTPKAKRIAKLVVAPVDALPSDIEAVEFEKEAVAA